MSYNPRCYSKMKVESVEMMVMAQWMMVMMIPMKSSVMMVMISPLRKGISPAGSPCQRALSLSMVFVLWRRRNISWTIPLN